MECIQVAFEGKKCFKILPNFTSEAFSVEVFDELKVTEEKNFFIEGSDSIVSDWKQANGMPGGAYSIQPPTLFKFDVGDKPCLPVFGRHFRNFSSKWVEKEVVKDVLGKIFKILKDEFPQNIEDWTEITGTEVDDLIKSESGIYKIDYNAMVSKEDFYQKVKKEFATNFTVENIHEARRRFAFL